ncbi:MAG: SRPBCC family protein [Proteobacteria bacterium]|nr:SRPBCC family protein [Pseudomonadota bacterium]
MLKYTPVIFFLYLLNQAAYAGQTLQVTKTMKLETSSEIVWDYVGDFCAIKEWHPAVAKCDITEEDSGKFRTLTLQDGAIIKEKHGGNNPTGYMYSITESPLPVKNYNALFEVDSNGDHSIITWTATFLAKDKPDNEAKEVISGIFDAGLASIKENLEHK